MSSTNSSGYECSEKEEGKMDGGNDDDEGKK